MRLPEQRLWDRFRNNCPPRLVRLNRVENAVGVGDPDVEIISRGKVSKVELKAVDCPPARGSTSLLPKGKGLSTEQENWLIEWLKHGGNGYVLIGVGSGQYLISCRTIAPALINSLTLLDVQHAALATKWHDIYAEFIPLHVLGGK